MKKSIIALIGLFTLVACSEDAYQEVNERVESGSLENNSGGTMMPMTSSTGYNSPFNPYGTTSNGVATTFTNNTPLLLELTPYGQDITVQAFFNNLSITYPYEDNTPFFAFEGQSFFIEPFATESNQDADAPVAVNAAPFGTSLGTIIYDFGSWSPNWRMYHYGKVYYFKYKIYSMGVPFEEGYIRHQFYGETDNSDDVNLADPNWVKVANADGLIPYHDAVVMYHRIQDEMCLTNKVGYTPPPLLSKITVIDPATAMPHTLEFTSDAFGIYVDFN